MNYIKRYKYSKVRCKGEWKHGILDTLQSKIVARCETYEDILALLMILNWHAYKRG